MKINVNYQQVAQQGTILSQKAGEYEQLINQIYQRMTQLQSIWQGSDHLAFMTQLEQFRPQLQKMKYIIDEYAQYISHSAQLYQQLQQDRIAKAKGLA